MKIQKQSLLLTGKSSKQILQILAFSGFDFNELTCYSRYCKILYLNEYCIFKYQIVSYVKYLRSIRKKVSEFLSVGPILTFSVLVKRSSLCLTTSHCNCY